MGKSRYQSGGAGYNSPERFVEGVNQQEFINQIGGVNNLNNMDLNAVAGQIITYLERISQGSQISEAKMAEMTNAIQTAVTKAPNSQQGAKVGMNMVNKLIMTETALMKSLQANIPRLQKGNNPIKDVNSSVTKQSIMLEQGMLRELSNLNKAMGTMQETFLDIQGNLNEQSIQEEDLFDSLKNTIINSALRSPTATAIGQLGAGLMNTALLKVAANEKMPSWLRKLAMTGVYMEVPQSLMNIIGEVFVNVISFKLAGAVGKNTLKALKGVPKAITPAVGNAMKGVTGMFGRLGGFMTQAFGGLSRLLPTLANPVVLAGTIAIGAITAGVMAHRNKMKQVDAQINSDPTLSEEEKLKARQKAHGKSGARAGVASGAVAGAAIGTLIGGPIGTAIGAGVGALVGGVGGWLIGRRKPTKELKEYKENMLKGGYESNIGKTTDDQERLIQAIERMEMALLGFIGSQEEFINEMKSEKRMSLWDRFFGGTDNGGARDRGAGPISTFRSQTQAQQNVDEYLKGNPNLVHMGSLGLAGTIDKGNSVPLTTRENASNIQFLDAFLQSKGYKVSYTSNMGGAHKGGSRSHASGNKMDFQLFDPVTGKPMKLRPEDAAILQSMGYWGAGTGALGWEPVKGQVGGGHYDVHTGGYIDKAAQERYLAGLKDKAERDAFEKAMANKPNVNPKNTDEVVELAKSKSSQTFMTPAPAGGGKYADTSNMGDFTNLVQQSATHNMINRG